MKSKSKILLRAALIFVAVIIYTSLFIYFRFNYFVWTTGLGMTCILLFYTWKMIRRYPAWYAAYMFDGKIVGLKKKVEKPRLFFYSVFWPPMVLSIYVVFSTPSTETMSNSILLYSLFISLFISGVAFLNLTWKSDFESRYIPFIRDAVAKRNYEFKAQIDDESLGSIFDGLISFGFLEYLDDSLRISNRKKFIRIFKEGYYPDKPLFKMKMDNIQTHYFFDCLKENINGLDLDGYLQIFYHDRNKKQPTEDSIRSSKSKSLNGPKRKEDLDAIFNK
ncbi:hypothetical protein KZP23_17695 [Echinicola marina]|uniref:hypothetical protein n=1 Tax=Echinicola marina TaxID=2859768 RepID=UPI001CF6AC81|nr:hypothetical protein [Echinicola marina]UCS92509.1 hypothetical protein KZP23_17695 [Echinicola marina]